MRHNIDLDHVCNLLADDIPLAAIARMLGVPRATLRSRLVRAGMPTASRSKDRQDVSDAVLRRLHRTYTATTMARALSWPTSTMRARLARIGASGVSGRWVGASAVDVAACRDTLARLADVPDWMLDGDAQTLS